VKLVLYTGRPGLVIGRKGQGAETLKNDLSRLVSKDVMLEIKEVRRPETDAQIVAEGIAGQLERRVAYRRAMKRAVSQALRMGAQGIKVACAGRLAGARTPGASGTARGVSPSIPAKRRGLRFKEAFTIKGSTAVKRWISTAMSKKRKRPVRKGA
jgi:small subunit ribosomal protein S3